MRRPEDPAEAARGAERLAELLREAERCVVLTGAGISVPSGVPDFRSPGTGLWAEVDPMEVAHIDAWRRDPDRFWAFYAERFASLGAVEPNAAHAAVVELERRGLVEAVITQNVDRLHRRAGTRRVVEVHGSIEWSICMVGHERIPLEEVLARIERSGRAPACASCGRPLKPDVTLFGEMLPERAIDDAFALAEGAELMLCIGSSLAVYPVASLPEVTLGSGGALAVVTQSATPYDERAAVRLGGDVVAELDAVLRALG